MQSTVILTTCKAPAWLEKVLWGYAAQSYKNFDLVISEDGAEPATACAIDYVRRETGLAIRHLTQPHRGFRKCVALNRAILAARGKYLIFSDGDCIPHPEFVAQHVSRARPGRFLSGGTVRLPAAISQRITAGDIRTGDATNWKWLARAGMWRRPKKLHLVALRGASAAMADWITPTRATWNGHNTSAWREDILAVNGFDERMRYGGLDRELGERMINAGTRPVQIRHRAMCVHLDHARGYVSADALSANQEIRRITRSTGTTWTEFGITSHLRSSDTALASSSSDVFSTVTALSRAA